MHVFFVIAVNRSQRLTISLKPRISAEKQCFFLEGGHCCASLFAFVSREVVVSIGLRGVPGGGGGQTIRAAKYSAFVWGGPGLRPGAQGKAFNADLPERVGVAESV